jgi:hypothetical protein
MPCSVEGKVYSSHTESLKPDPYILIFENQTHQPKKIYFLDFLEAKGARRFKQTIPAGGKWRAVTYALYTWLVANEQGECLSIWESGSFKGPKRNIGSFKEGKVSIYEPALTVVTLAKLNHYTLWLTTLKPTMQWHATVGPGPDGAPTDFLWVTSQVFRENFLIQEQKTHEKCTEMSALDDLGWTSVPFDSPRAWHSVYFSQGNLKIYCLDEFVVLGGPRFTVLTRLGPSPELIEVLSGLREAAWRLRP